MAGDPAKQDDTQEETAPRDGGAGVLGAPTDPRQLDMLADEKGQMPANVLQIARANHAKAKSDEPRGPGRPKGSRNKRTQALEALIPHKYGDPVEFQASV